MEAKQFLERIIKINSLIRNKQQIIEFEEAEVCSMPTTIYTDVRVQTSKNTDKMTDNIIRLEEKKEKIQKQIVELWDERHEKILLLEELNPKDYDFLFKHYVLEMTLPEIAEANDGRSLSWAKQQKRKSIDALQILLERSRLINDEK